MIQSMNIAILNLMPAKEETERQLTELLQKNNQNIVHLRFLYPKTHYENKPVPDHLLKKYQSLDKVNLNEIDAVIITGAPVEQIPFEEVDYWTEITLFLDEIKLRHLPSLFICWAAQAALFHYYDIPKIPLSKKCVGVFSHTPLQKDHVLLKNCQKIFYAPHSRYTTIDHNQLIQSYDFLQPLAYAKEAGVYLISSLDNRQVFVLGHPEYQIDTLAWEYQRDLTKNPNAPYPLNYFKYENKQWMPTFNWQKHRQNFFTNWLNLVTTIPVPY